MSKQEVAKLIVDSLFLSTQSSQIDVGDFSDKAVYYALHIKDIYSMNRYKIGFTNANDLARIEVITEIIEKELS